MQPLVEINLANPSKPSSWTYKSLCLFKQTVEKLNPAIRIHLSTSKQGAEMGQLMNGSLDMATVSMADISAVMKDKTFELLTKPYVFHNIAHLTRFYNGPIGQELFEKIRVQANVEILCPLYIGNRVISLRTKHSVSKPQDLIGVLLRVPEAPSWQEVAKSLGAVGVPVSIANIQKAYESNDIDGHENPLSACVAYELMPYINQIIKTDHIVDCIFLSMSKNKWDTLNSSQQRTIKIATLIARKFNDEERLREETILLLKHRDLIIRPNLQPFRTFASISDPFLDQVKMSCHPAILEEHRLVTGLGQYNCKPGTLVETDKGNIVAAWYGGADLKDNRESDVATSIWTASYSQGYWTKPECHFIQQGFKVWNPVLVNLSAGNLALFFRKFPFKTDGKRDFTYNVMLSPNHGEIWTSLKHLPDHFMGPTKCSPIKLKEGSWLMPSSNEEECHLEKASSDLSSWEHLKKIDTHLVTEPCFIPDSQGKIKIFFRNKQKEAENRFVLSTTFDAETSALEPIKCTTIPNPDSGIDGVRLKDGRMLLVGNPSHHTRNVLALFISKNEGETWSPSITLQEGEGAYAQPAIMQARDGRVHVIYSWWPKDKSEKNIVHLVLDPQQIS